MCAYDATWTSEINLNSPFRRFRVCGSTSICFLNPIQSYFMSDRHHVVLKPSSNPLQTIDKVLWLSRGSFTAVVQIHDPIYVVFSSSKAGLYAYMRLCVCVCVCPRWWEVECVATLPETVSKSVVISKEFTAGCLPVVDAGGSYWLHVLGYSPLKEKRNTLLPPPLPRIYDPETFFLRPKKTGFVYACLSVPASGKKERL